MVTLHTNHGDIVINTFDSKAPITVRNFLQHCRQGFYNGTIFHRAIHGFIVQGGGFEPNMQEKKAQPSIKNEANNGLKNTRGTLAMARTHDPHSASTQFFINVVDNDFLNFRSEKTDEWGYCVFAEVTAGLDLIDQIEEMVTVSHGIHQDVPIDDIIITHVTCSE